MKEFPSVHLKMTAVRGFFAGLWLTVVSALLVGVDAQSTESVRLYGASYNANDRSNPYNYEQTRSGSFVYKSVSSIYKKKTKKNIISNIIM